jgi:hypothetical protein
MVAGNNDLRCGQLIEEGPSRSELAGSRALRQVAGDRDNIRLNVVDRPNEWSDSRFVNAPEMNIG